ncbi:hypothetical protein OG500_37790 [Kitasatospora sp. NBC_01250]|uniref:hypothetical protein n=1 Tax=Kitasatospora sp. NBC_01250 TaxID=2903571 RepID=UPI002E305713|nr:hypothetical protein [Kitasatospora sp. NBC_01250]
MNGYATEGWTDMFLCAGGAAAALCGLIFVGLSVNIRTVLAIEKREGHSFMTGRALEALVALLVVLLISLVGLTPAINPGVLAAFVLVNAVASAVSPCRAAYAGRGRSPRATEVILRRSLAAALTLTLLTAGTSLAAGHGGGLHWLPAAFVLAVTVAAVNAWVLLVEVLR